MSGCTILSVSQGRKDFNEAVALFSNSDCGKAVPRFADAVQKEPGLREAYVYMAECSLQKGDFKETLSLAKQGISVNAQHNKINGRLKIVLMDGGQRALASHDNESAVLFFKEAVALDQADSSLHILLGKALLARGTKGDMKAALIEFKTALNKSSQEAQNTELIRNVLFERAKEYSVKGDMYAASRCYLAYTENFNPNDVEACIALGNIFSKTGNPVGALYYAQKAHAIDPKNKAAMELLNDLNGPIHP
jgi:tetratricopeptide (TPR) repeat protein